MIQFADYLPVEHLDKNYALVLYLLNERVENINMDRLIEKKIYMLYFNLFQTSLVESLSIVKLEVWLNYLFSLFESKKSSALEYSNDIFEKLIKKCVRRMLINDSLDNMQKFVEKVRNFTFFRIFYFNLYFNNFESKLFERIPLNSDNLNYQSVAHLTLIQILEKLSKVKFYFKKINLNFLKLYIF